MWLCPIGGNLKIDECNSGSDCKGYGCGCNCNRFNAHYYMWPGDADAQAILSSQSLATAVVLVIQIQQTLFIQIGLLVCGSHSTVSKQLRYCQGDISSD